jgi:hypothetical protein
MTWTRLGDEFGPETRDLTDAEFRLHVEALLWSNYRLLDLVIPKRDLKRFAETDDFDSAAKGLVAAGWWKDRGEEWYVGCRFPEWQFSSEEVAADRDRAALRMKRLRWHRKNDHSLCTAPACKDIDVRANVPANVPPSVLGRVGSGRVGSGRGPSPTDTDPGPPGSGDGVGHGGEPCAHGTPGGAARCALCRRGIGAPDGEPEPGSGDSSWFTRPAETPPGAGP